MRLLFMMALGVFALDQITKWYVVHWLDLKTLGALDVVPPVLNLRMAWNHGINFGLFANLGDAARWILIAIALAIVAFVLGWMRRDPPGRLGFVSAGVLVGGALGNVVDRIVYGAVADFLNMSCCGFVNPYAFNVADIAVFAGAIGLVFFAAPEPADEKNAP